MTTQTDGWVTKVLAGDAALGVIPVETSLATCPYCAMRWGVANLPEEFRLDGRALIHCAPEWGGCTQLFRMEVRHDAR